MAGCLGRRPCPAGYLRVTAHARARPPTRRARRQKLAPPPPRPVRAKARARARVRSRARVRVRPRVRVRVSSYRLYPVVLRQFWHRATSVDRSAGVNPSRGRGLLWGRGRAIGVALGVGLGLGLRLGRGLGSGPGFGLEFGLAPRTAVADRGRCATPQAAASPPGSRSAAAPMVG